jgi:hypothetical protein
LLPTLAAAVVVVGVVVVVVVVVASASSSSSLPTPTIAEQTPPGEPSRRHLPLRRRARLRPISSFVVVDCCVAATAAAFVANGPSRASK